MREDGEFPFFVDGSMITEHKPSLPWATVAESQPCSFSASSATVTHCPLPHGQLGAGITKGFQ